MYPEWIQEQLDALTAATKRQAPSPSDEWLVVHLAAVEARILNHITAGMIRIEAKLDRLLKYCEEA
jgi:hypothetical protein